jgi:hypothetical protein
VKYFVPALLLVLLLPVMTTAQTQQPPPKKWFVGGWLGLSFGDVDYVSISPVIGYRVNSNVSAGVGLEYAYRNDDRFGQDLSTSDYGGSVFTHVYVSEGMFAAASYEYLRFEYFDFAGQKVSDEYSSVFIGGGFAQPVGDYSAFIMSAMYNLSWSDSEPSPYDSPWVLGAGVSVGF